MSHHDAIVIGAGLAGLSAAVRLAEDGARVLVLGKGVGATHLSAGTIDIVGYAPERVERPAEALARFGDGHPYALVGAGAVAASVDWLKAVVAGGSLAPYAYHGGLDETAAQAKAVGMIVVPQVDAANRIGTVIAELQARRDEMARVIERAEGMHAEAESCARLLTSAGADAMAAVRERCDALELVVGDELWPLPKYREMLFPV